MVVIGAGNRLYLLGKVSWSNVAAHARIKMEKDQP